MFNKLSQFFHFFGRKSASVSVVANQTVNPEKLAVARRILLKMQKQLPDYIAKGSGPFLAALYDEKGNLIAKEANHVVTDNCSHNHAEMNVIRAAEKKLNTYDLSSYNLRLYVTAEPCLMCLGGIMWSGIKEVYYGVPSQSVEKITGFDEGFKPDWLDEFKQRGIVVYGNIEIAAGEEVLQNYVKGKHTIYRPQRK
ncbi:MAG: nucleoside deaminase [Alphaproteobacteria bacterium]|nr:nucleoside deaminase [Alphaproteobacteria bacterium]